MTEKTKAIILIVIIFAATIGFGVYFVQKNKVVSPTPQTVVDQPVIEKSQTFIIDGKLRSMNEKQIYIELADGKGSAINIALTTPVKIEGNEIVSNLSILEIGAMVSVEVDNDNNAVGIVIKK